MTIHHHGFKKEQPFTFHPYEIAFCGYSNSGKTTLITKFVRAFSQEYRIGYLKHDVHSFTMDHEGKDTYRVKHSGAHAVFISDEAQFAQIRSAGVEDAVSQGLFLDNDLFFVEGYKELPLPKIVVLDPQEKILGAFERAELTRPIAFVGNAARPARVPAEYPFFHRDDIDGIKRCLEAHLAQCVRRVPLYGLVLAGGKSLRMKRDKSALVYHGKTQTEHCFDLLSAHCERVFVSNRSDQSHAPGHENLPQIHDTFLEIGPLGGILSAMAAYRDAAWLVVACDLPFITGATLEALRRQRNPFQIATAYRSAHDGLPEPLCAVYEPKSYARLLQSLGNGCTCPRKILIHSRVKLLQPQDQTALDNVNNPQEYEQALAVFSKGGAGVKV